MQSISRLVPVPVNARRSHTQRAEQAIRTHVVMILASTAMLLAIQIAWAAVAHAQANISLSNAGLTGVLATNTNWSIAKNGGFAGGTATWTVGVTKVSVTIR